MQGSDCAGGHGQHNCGFLYQQGRRYEVRLSLCPPVEAPILVSSQGNDLEGQIHSGSLECDSRQVVQTSSGDPNRVVAVPEGVQPLVQQVGDSTDRPVCHQIQQQIAQVCVSGSRPDSMGGRRPESPMGDPGRLCLSTGLSPGEGSVQSDKPGLSQDDRHCSGLAQHVMVLGPSLPVKPDSGDPSGTGGSGDSALQRGLPTGPPESESAFVDSRVSTIQEQGFSEEVAARIEAPQRSSIRAIYKSKWAVFVKWCETSQVDFR